MKNVAPIGVQLLAWALLGLLVLAFADGPSFNPLPAGHGQLTLAIAHLSERLEPCRKLSESERMELPPTRRVTEVCERARVPIKVELVANDRTLLSRELEPSGFHDDGRIFRIETWPLPAGHYRTELTLTGRSVEASQRAVFEFFLAPRDNAVVDIEDHEIRLVNVTEPIVEHRGKAASCPGLFMTQSTAAAPDPAPTALRSVAHPRRTGEYVSGALGRRNAVSTLPGTTSRRPAMNNSTCRERT